MIVTDDSGRIGAERIGMPLGFAVPDGWVPVEPTAAGTPGAVFVAVRAGAPDGSGFTPNITVGVDRRTDDADVSDVADEAIGRLAATVADLVLVERTVLGDRIAPCVAQVLRVHLETEGELLPRSLVQSQVHLVIPLSGTPTDRIVVEMACTCGPDQVGGVTGDFQQFVASFHIKDAGEAESEGNNGCAR